MFMTKKDREIANLKAMINNRNKLIEALKEENKCLYNENKELRNENENLKDCIKEFEKLSKEKHFNSAENLQNKMKSILDDYHTNPICNL